MNQDIGKGRSVWLDWAGPVVLSVFLSVGLVVLLQRYPALKYAPIAIHVLWVLGVMFLVFTERRARSLPGGELHLHG